MTKKNLSEPIAEGKLNEVIRVVTKRKNGTLRIQQDFQFCPSLAEQHTAHLSDLNYLIETYKPDEVAAYMAMRASRPEIVGHDFSQEPSLQEANTFVYHLKQNFLKLPEDIRNQFRNHVEFLKFIDNPANQEKMLRLGLLTKKEIADNTSAPTTTKQPADEAATKQTSNQSSSSSSSQQ